MLGVPYDMGIDMWSAGWACAHIRRADVLSKAMEVGGTTVYELSTGKILFTGKTNNQMVAC